MRQISVKDLTISMNKWKILTKQVKRFTAVDKTTGWLKIVGIDNKGSDSIAILFGNE